ncbi:hypothetical protein I6I99_21180 [Sphingobacterium multivorum]|nr:hypothetical protein [Sphingobacterium multivorum]QQT29830.1 hypothetical protein I6I99_21180 [Sphingobacterium multivorum]
MDLKRYKEELGEFGQALVLKNEAVRTQEFRKYEQFLLEHFPDSVKEDLEKAKKTKVLKFNKDQLRSWIEATKVNMLESDLYAFDYGSIVTGHIVSGEALRLYSNDSLEDIICTQILPSDFLNMTDYEEYFVNIRVRT